MEQAKPKSRRRTILVDKRSQLYLSLTTILYLVVYTIILLAFTLVPSILKFTRQTLPIQERFQASREFLFLDQRVVPAVVITMIIIAVHFVFISNRIFGPLARLRKVLLQWGEGVWPKNFRGRPKDFHQELFASFNTAAEKMREDLNYIRDRLNSALDTMRQAPKDDMPAESSASLKEAEQKCRAALDKINKYSL